MKLWYYRTQGHFWHSFWNASISAVIVIVGIALFYEIVKLWWLVGFIWKLVVIIWIVFILLMTWKAHRPDGDDVID